MKIVHKYDEKGYWVPAESVDIYPDSLGKYNIPDGYTEVALPVPNYKPKFQNGEWIETATTDEIENVITPAIEPETKVLGQQNAQLSYELMLAQAELDTANQTLSDLTYQLMINGVI